MNQTREQYIEGAKHNSLYWAERACNAGSEGLMYTMLVQWAMGDELREFIEQALKEKNA